MLSNHNLGDSNFSRLAKAQIYFNTFDNSSANDDTLG